MCDLKVGFNFSDGPLRSVFSDGLVTYDVRAVTATFHHEISRGLNSQRSSKKKAV